MKRLSLLTVFLTFFKIFSAFAISENKSSDYLHREAEKLIAVHRFEEALRLYEEAALNTPNNDEAYARIGSIYKILGRSRKSIEAYEISLMINPNNQEAYENLESLQHPDGALQSELLSD